MGTGTGPLGIAVSPDGNSVYASTQINAFLGSVSQYDVAADGTLSPKTAPTVFARRQPSGIVVSPDGASVYVANSFSANVSQYDVGAGGALSPKGPPAVSAKDTPLGVAIAPDGASVYVANFEELDPSLDISQYDVGADGTLSPKSPAGVASGMQPIAGASVYAPNTSSFDVYQYDVGAGGALSPKSPATVATGMEPSAIAMRPDGNSVYVTNMSSNTVSGYDVGTGGNLSPKSPASVEAGKEPVGVAVSPDTTPPELSLSAQRQPVRKFVRVRAECENEDCDAIANGRLRIRLTGKAQTTKVKASRRLRETTAALLAGEPMTLKLRTKARGRRAAKRALRRGHRANARVRVKAADLSGNQTTSRIKVRLG